MTSIIRPEGYWLRDEAAEGITRTGEILGTPKYMSPEQVRSEPVDGRSDQFSLAVIAYELLSGRSPFAADSVSGLLYKIAHDPPPPLPAEANLSDSVEATLRRSLAKSPSERFPDCRSFAAALAVALHTEKFSDTDRTAALRPTPAPGAGEPAASPAAALASAEGDFTLLLHQQKTWLIAFGRALSVWLRTVFAPWARRRGGAFMLWLSDRAVPALDRGTRATVRWLDSQWRAWLARLKGPYRYGWGVLLLSILMIGGTVVYKGCISRKRTQKSEVRKAWDDFRGIFK